MRSKRKCPSVALIWMYKGKNAEARRQVVEQLEYPDFRIVETIQSIPKDADVCVFWMDDEKPVGRDFIDQMTRPLIAGKDLRAVMHFWSGNAISIPKSLLDASAIEDPQAGVQSLLQLLLPALDAADKQPNGRVHLAFSSTERLGPVTLEPVGYPS